MQDEKAVTGHDATTGDSIQRLPIHSRTGHPPQESSLSQSGLDLAALEAAAQCYLARLLSLLASKLHADPEAYWRSLESPSLQPSDLIVCDQSV